VKPNKYNPHTHSGRFNKRVSLHGPVVRGDEIGNQIEQHDELIRVWAMIKTLKGSEYYAAAQTNAVYVTRFVVRYSKQLEALLQQHKTKIEIHYKQVVYDIQSVINDDEMNQTFTILTKGRP